MPEINCEKCGIAVRPGDRFCRKCGASIRNRTASPQPASASPPEQGRLNRSGRSWQIRRVLLLGFIASFLYVMLGSAFKALFDIEFPYRTEVVLIDIVLIIALFVFDLYRRHTKQAKVVALVAGILLLVGGVAAVLNNRATIDKQMRNLASPDSQTRSQAAQALGKKKARRAVEPLIVAMQADTPAVRKEAAFALGQIGDARAVEPLILALQEVDPGVRLNVVMALGMIGDPRAVAPLTDEMWNGNLLAAGALKNLGAPAIEPLIAALIKGNADLQDAAAGSLGLMGSAAVEPLIALSEDKNDNLRFHAAFALALTDDRRAAARLTAAFAQGDLAITAGASDFFIKAGQAGTEPQLILALDAFGSEEMATKYLNCGNVQLENAARRWAQIHGFTIGSYPGGASVGWGQK